jgi:SAM-dependent methyltransferase
MEMQFAVPPGAAQSGARTYAETVSRGFYAHHVGGLSGKHDNVRTFWEDEVIRMALRPHLGACVDRCRREGRGVRLLDLGAGAGQGYEILTSIPAAGLGLDDDLRYVLATDEIDCYVGLDLSQAMVAKGTENHRRERRARFAVADLRQGLGPVADEPPYDVYYSSYGSLSHLDTPALRRLLRQIVAHARPGALVVLDLVGRLSPEWPGYWQAPDEAATVRDYSMSYLYESEERALGQVERFPLRFWTGRELREFCAAIDELAPRGLTALRVEDRSIFVGRHLDTREYGPMVPPLRQVVNRLLEADVRTNLDDLRVTIDPVPDQDGVNEFLAELARCWNTLIDFAAVRLPGRRVDLVRMDGWSGFPPALHTALINMDRVVDSVAWFRTSDVRANLVEPQLAYLLRDLEIALQRGLGCGHGLLAVLAVGSDRRSGA